jgi:hypothetical protein
MSLLNKSVITKIKLTEEKSGWQIPGFSRSRKPGIKISDSVVSIDSIMAHMH